MKLFKKEKPSRRQKPIVLKARGEEGISYQIPGLPDEEFMDELSPPEGLKIYRKMEMVDPVVGGLILELKSILSSLNWEINGPNANFVESMLFNLPGGIRQLLIEISSCASFGFYIGEEIWSNKEGTYVLEDIAPRYQPTIYAINNEKGDVEQQTSSDQFLIPYSKVVHHTIMSTNRNPYGTSLLRPLYKPYYYKLSIEATEATGMDRDLGGLPVMTAPEGFNFTEADSTSPNYNPETEATLEWAIDTVSNIRRDQQQGLVKPHGWSFEVIRGEIRTQMPTEGVLGRYNSEMACGLLENFIALGAFATTNNANIEVNVNNFLAAVDAWGASIANTLNKGPIAKICWYNKLEEPPTLKFLPTNREKLTDLASFVARLTSNGIITPTTSLESTLLKMANLPYDPDNKKTEIDAE